MDWLFKRLKSPFTGSRSWSKGASTYSQASSHQKNTIACGPSDRFRTAAVELIDIATPAGSFDCNPQENPVFAETEQKKRGNEKREDGSERNTRCPVPKRRLWGLATVAKPAATHLASAASILTSQRNAVELGNHFDWLTIPVVNIPVDLFAFDTSIKRQPSSLNSRLAFFEESRQWHERTVSDTLQALGSQLHVGSQFQNKKASIEPIPPTSDNLEESRINFRTPALDHLPPAPQVYSPPFIARRLLQLQRTRRREGKSPSFRVQSSTLLDQSPVTDRTRLSRDSPGSLTFSHSHTPLSVTTANSGYLAKPAHPRIHSHSNLILTLTLIAHSFFRKSVSLLRRVVVANKPGPLQSSLLLEPESYLNGDRSASQGHPKHRAPVPNRQFEFLLQRSASSHTLNAHVPASKALCNCGLWPIRLVSLHRPPSYLDLDLDLDHTVTFDATTTTPIHLIRRRPPFFSFALSTRLTHLPTYQSHRARDHDDVHPTKQYYNTLHSPLSVYQPRIIVAQGRSLRASQKQHECQCFTPTLALPVFRPPVLALFNPHSARCPALPTLHYLLSSSCQSHVAALPFPSRSRESPPVPDPVPVALSAHSSQSRNIANFDFLRSPTFFAHHHTCFSLVALHLPISTALPC
ncbi:uncharacterized protein CLUP02_14011 [Colletotrichum lupini]|uniref:Uncharacterized protein n=1 Tax=Colletotrichum lupini TaxID=145971 RepID=A0A9Q8T5B3_9PEZI|nr:uncharacterized protein CLUP02_14011 [Colletotrichum lupini]UQC88487.1 hypothetical protein CLUP02_14011 [Colletotrichum lupini]